MGHRKGWMDASCSQMSHTRRIWVVVRSVERVSGWEGLKGSLGRVVMNKERWEKTLLEGGG